MTKSRNLIAKKHAWTARELQTLRERYADEPTARLADELGLRMHVVSMKAYQLGLKKSIEYLASPAACRLRRGDEVGKAFRYPKGHVPANKGQRMPGWAPGRMGETQFRKGNISGHAAQIVKPIGATRISKDGYLERKVNNDLPFQRRWRAEHLLLWESVHGPLPKGHAVVFRNGDRTDIRIENLACIPRIELMRRNTVHNLPPELVQVVQLKGALKRQISRRESREKQD